MRCSRTDPDERSSGAVSTATNRTSTDPVQFTVLSSCGVALLLLEAAPCLWLACDVYIAPDGDAALFLIHHVRACNLLRRCAHRGFIGSESGELWTPITLVQGDTEQTFHYPPAGRKLRVINKADLLITLGEDQPLHVQLLCSCCTPILSPPLSTVSTGSYSRARKG